MKVVKYSPEYEIVFSLMNEDPNLLLVDWDIEQAIAGSCCYLIVRLDAAFY